MGDKPSLLILIGAIFIIIALILIIIGVVLIIINQELSVPWYLWIFIGGGLILGIIGSIMLITGLLIRNKCE